MSINCIHCGANPRDGIDLLCTGCRREKARKYVLEEGTRAATRLRTSSLQQGLSDEQHQRCVVAANELAGMVMCLAEHVGHPGPTKYDAARLLLDFLTDILLSNIKVVATVGEELVHEVGKELNRQAAAELAAKGGGH